MTDLWNEYNALARKTTWFSSIACLVVFMGSAAICSQFVPPAPDWNYFLLHLVSAVVASIAYFVVRNHYASQAQGKLDAIDAEREVALQLGQ